MRRPFVAGNWKLNRGPADAVTLAEALRSAVPPSIAATVAVFPTTLSVADVARCLSGSAVAVGVQDVAPVAQGAWTGDTSAAMARAIGCDFALVGHSERRSRHHESIESTRGKVVATLDAGLLPILCVGETLAERQAGQAEATVLAQLAGALAGLPDDRLSGVSVAYEPVWAIGTGQVATPEVAQAMHATLRGWLAANRPAWVAADLRILYGGSVAPGNARELLAMPDIDGALVGGASLDAASFLAILDAALSDG